MSSIVLVGPPGSGKTTMASTMTKLGYTLDLLDWDKKARGMANLQPLIKSGQINVIEPKEPMNPTGLKTTLTMALATGVNTASKIQPKGYLEFIDLITNREKEPPSDANKRVLCLDSVTALGRHMRRFLQYIAKQSAINFDAWAFLKANYQELFDCFFGLTPPYAHCIAICHEMAEEERSSKLTKIKPMIEGSFRDEIGSFTEEMYHLEVEANKLTNVSKFWAINKPVGNIHQARTSRDVPVRVEADFSVIFKGEGV